MVVASTVQRQAGNAQHREMEREEDRARQRGRGGTTLDPCLAGHEELGTAEGGGDMWPVAAARPKPV